MIESLQERIRNSLDEAECLYHRLVLLVGPSGVGKTAALREYAATQGATLVNVNLRLSEQLLDLTMKQRALRLPELLDGVLQGAGDPVILDNTEILFDTSLKLDPLRLLQGISRHRVVLASWNGTLEDRRLRYAENGHPEFRSYESADALIVNLEAK